MSSSEGSLFPDYHYVEEFGDDDDYEKDENGNVIEEVEYVTIDLGVVEPTLVPSTSSYRLIGLDTPNPFLQLSGTIFKGKHQTLLGTELLFTDAQDDHSGRGKRPLVHVANTERRIAFKEVELRPKGSSEKAKQQTDAQHSGGSSSKKRRPQTLEQLVGNEAVDEPVSRGRGGRRKTKDKSSAEAESDVRDGEGVEVPRGQGDPMDTSEG